MPADEQRIAAAIGELDARGKELYVEALGQGYKNEICPECGAVFLAHHHLTRCQSPTCPMKARGVDGKLEPTILEQLLAKCEDE